MDETPPGSGQPALPDLFDPPGPDRSAAPNTPRAPQPPQGTAGPPVEVQRSRRRKRTATAYWRAGTIVVVLPHRVGAAQAERLTTSLVSRLIARAERDRPPGDAGLADRARTLGATYLAPVLDSVPEPASVTWVTNQNSRWGSCTMPDRTIRLSHRLQAMPSWVVDYVLVHELAHLVHSDHSPAFWALVNRYPRVERARGYLDGWTDGRRQTPDQPLANQPGTNELD